MNELKIIPIGTIKNEDDGVDEAAGTVGLYHIDALSGSPVLDLKPYTPSIDRVERATTPVWCCHWPQSYEQSGDFDWAAEFNF